MKTYLLAFTLVLEATPSFACTAEEAQAKAMEAATKMEHLIATDPQKAAEVAKKLSDVQTQAATDLAGACKMYDDMLAELG